MKTKHGLKLLIGYSKLLTPGEKRQGISFISLFPKVTGEYIMQLVVRVHGRLVQIDIMHYMCDALHAKTYCSTLCDN